MDKYILFAERKIGPNHISSKSGVLCCSNFDVNGIFFFILKIFYLGIWRRMFSEDKFACTIPEFFQELFVSLYSTYILFYSHDSEVKEELKEMKKKLTQAVDYLNTFSEIKLTENFQSADLMKYFRKLFYSGALLCYFEKSDYLIKLSEDNPKHLNT